MYIFIRQSGRKQSETNTSVQAHKTIQANAIKI